MNGYNFTERVRKVLAMAREEAARLHHEYVGTEHILLGLIREGEGVAAAVLQNLSVDLDEIQQKIEETVKKGKASQATGPDLPYTSRAKKVLDEWDRMVPLFVKVMPKDYKRVLACVRRVQAQGLTGDEAVMAAFEENARDLSRVGGN